jgi:hypothetical protein
VTVHRALKFLLCAACGEDYSLDIVMDSKGVLTEDGFTIEVAIPFKSLRYEAGKDKRWGLHINRRVKYMNNEYNSWMPINRSISGWLNQAGQITGLEGIETTRQLEINPSLTLSESGRRTRYTFDGHSLSIEDPMRIRARGLSPNKVLRVEVSVLTQSKAPRALAVGAFSTPHGSTLTARSAGGTRWNR